MFVVLSMLPSLALIADAFLPDSSSGNEWHNDASRRNATARPLQGSSSLNDSDQHDNDGDDQKDMNKITHRIATHQPQQPQNGQYYGNRPQHMILL
jgi:hypothetical protein